MVYAAALGVEWRHHTFDGGQTVTLTYQGFTWRGSYNWGDDATFLTNAQHFLDGLPWPTSDDPRVATEGTYRA